MLACCVVLAGLVLQFWDSPTVGPLSHSVATAAGNYVGSCRHSAGRRWRCSLVSYDGSDGGIEYALTADGRCWTARILTTGRIGDLPVHMNGCIDLFDRLGDDGSSFVVGRGYY
jgi:hypothetical protein